MPTPKDNSSELLLKVTERSPLIVPKEFEPFARSFDSKYAQGEFLGIFSSERESIQRSQFNRTRGLAKLKFMQGPSALESTPQALKKTMQAAKDFFTLSYQFLAEKQAKFPLAGLNKCLGMVVVPTTNLVILAISEDKNPKNDVSLRQNMLHFLNQLNQINHTWTFELACVPTKSQYLMPRTLSMRAPHEATQESVDPHTRCVEVALMAAVCKTGRFLKFEASDIGIVAYGNTLWASPEGSKPIPHFESEVRNKKYTKKPPLEVKLTDSMSGWIDIWEPCDGHCKIYKYEMIAIAASGGSATSFIEPRAEWEPPSQGMTL